MKKNVMVFANDELEVKVRTIKNDDGSISVNAEIQLLDLDGLKLKSQEETKNMLCGQG